MKRSVLKMVVFGFLIGSIPSLFFFLRQGDPGAPVSVRHRLKYLPRLLSAQAIPQFNSGEVIARRSEVPEEAEVLKKFDDLMVEAFDKMPTLQELKKLTDEQTHHTPPLMVEAAYRLGEIAQLLHDHPQLKPQALEFYHRCAESSDYPTSIRASCYHRLRRLDPQSADPHPVPENVKKIADYLES